MRNDRVRMLCRCIIWFGTSFFLSWLAGVGSLLEHIVPLRALVTTSIILTIILEAVYQWEMREEKK